MPWNPADKGANVVLGNGNADAWGSASTFNSVRGTVSRTEGYFELVLTAASAGASVVVGVGDAAFSLANYPGASANSAGVQWIATPTLQPFVSGVARINGFTNIPTSVPGDVFMIYVRDGDVWFGRNGVWTSGDPSAGTPNVSGFTGPVFPAVGTYNAANVISLRTAPPFVYPIPTGGTAWEAAAPPPPSSFITASEFHVSLGPSRQYIGPVFCNSYTLAGPPAFTWATVDLATVDPAAASAKAAFLSGILIITSGSTSEIADLGVVFRKPGDTSITCDIANFTGQAVNTIAGDGKRQNLSTWVPTTDGKFEWAWYRSTGGQWPTNASYGVNLTLQAWVK